MGSDIQDICVSTDSSIRRAIECIDRSREKVALVIDGQSRLLDIVTDGDVRRAMLAGKNLDSPITVLREQKATSGQHPPLTAPVGTSHSSLLRLMQESGVRQVPLLDKDGRVSELVTLAELFPNEDLPLRAVVMAGGYGTRLRPLTENLPKPMLPLGDRPLLERILDQLRQTGMRCVYLATHYKEAIIENHFGDGSAFGLEIKYLEEQSPQGTAGALSLMEPSQEPLLVINGDILTQVDFLSMLNFHKDHGADMTVAVKEHQVKLAYGVVEIDGVDITGISEKPALRHFINAGIYLLNPEMCQRIPTGQPYDMTDLIALLLAEKRKVVSFPIHESWLDIGQMEDYHRAQAEIGRGGA